MINHLVLFTPPFIHVAVAGMDATYGAYVAAEKNTLKNTNNNISANNTNNSHSKQEP